MLITGTKKTSNTLKNVVLVFLLLNFSTTFSQKKVIVVDPGHGGKDSGAIGINGIKEKDITLNIAKEILRLNKTIFNNKYDIYLTRYKDTLISLTDRTKIPKALKANAFISIHCNASKTNSKGIEVYVNNSNSPSSKASIVLGTLILDEATEKIGFVKRGLKFSNFQVLRETTDSMPAVLVELGFLSNTDESNHYQKPQSFQAIAALFLDCINKNIGSIEEVVDWSDKVYKQLTTLSKDELIAKTRRK